MTNELDKAGLEAAVIALRKEHDHNYNALYVADRDELWQLALPGAFKLATEIITAYQAAQDERGDDMKDQEAIRRAFEEWYNSNITAPSSYMTWQAAATLQQKRIEALRAALSEAYHFLANGADIVSTQHLVCVQMIEQALATTGEI